MLTWIWQYFVFIAHASQKLFRKDLLGGQLDPLVLEKLIESRKAWRSSPALFARHQYLEFDKFCLPVSPVDKSTCLILHQFNSYVSLICGKEIGDD